MILGDSCAETLLKADQIELLKYFSTHPVTIKEYWGSIKICIRNHYKILDAGIWFDYLQLLKHFGKDLYNTKYICPDDIKRTHDRLVMKKRERDQKLKLFELREKIAEDQKEYEKHKGRFFNICFTDGELSIQPLTSVEDFLIEGDILHHCIFTNQYYKREDSLILSARIKNIPVETIEVSLQNLSILQARGMNNHTTEYHERIVSLVNNHIIKQIVQSA